MTADRWTAAPSYPCYFHENIEESMQWRNKAKIEELTP